MRRPWHIWSGFVLILLVVFPAVGWLSVRVLQLERDELDAKAQFHSAQEKLLRLSRVRLSLWHMDTALAPLLAREAARPYFLYKPFVPRIVKDKTGKATTKYIQSPILTQPEHVRLHFQCTIDGELSSPQNPTGLMCRLAIANGVDKSAIAANGQLLAKLQRRVNWRSLLPLLPTETLSAELGNTLPFNQLNPPNVAQSGQNAPAQTQQAALPQQLAPNKVGNPSFNPEVQQRAQVVRNYAQGIGNQQQESWNPSLGSNKLTGRERVIRPVWIGEDLLLARRVVVDGRTLIQGCWLDWTKLRQSLLATVDHILPQAQLVPVRDNGPATDLEWTMVSLPAKLVLPRQEEPQTAALAGWITPIQLSLATAWTFLILAVVAIALLLRGVVALSERRAAFVSAVTHELRTPLTTFRMYSEMLSSGMVPHEKQSVYIDTLNEEAERLTHLVDNVLAYARLERGAVERRREAIAVGELLDRVKPRLQDRGAEVEHRIVVDMSSELADTVVNTDPRAVEQILFNLVDNACKYGQSKERRIEMAAATAGDQVALSVRDYGVGMSEAQRAKLFRPFSKSADEAADSAPGVGLGLALCRRLARDLGGDITFEPAQPGSIFTLRIG